MTANAITLLVDGAQAFPEILRAIQQARTSVEINMFIWRDDRIGNRMGEAVLAAADRGVQVHLDLDRYGVVLEKCEEEKTSFFHKTQSLSEKLKIKALEWIYPETCRGKGPQDVETPLYRQIMAHPNITVRAHRFKADHSKYYIIDQEILFLGGINIEDKENGQDRRGRVYGDYMAKLIGREYVRAFRAKLEDGEDLLDGIFFGINRKYPVRRFQMEQLYLDLINNARQELHITMAYFSPLKPFVDAIVRAWERGVQVTLIIPAQANFQNDSNQQTVKNLLKKTNGGIQVYLSPRMLHTKLVMNEEWISFGSTNITKKAFAQLDEANLFLKNRDCPFRQTLLESIARDKEDAWQVRDHREIRFRRFLAFLEGFLV